MGTSLRESRCRLPPGVRCDAAGHGLNSATTHAGAFAQSGTIMVYSVPARRAGRQLFMLRFEFRAEAVSKMSGQVECPNNPEPACSPRIIRSLTITASVRASRLFRGTAYGGNVMAYVRVVRFMAHYCEDRFRAVICLAATNCSNVAPKLSDGLVGPLKVLCRVRDVHVERQTSGEPIDRSGRCGVPTYLGERSHALPAVQAGRVKSRRLRDHGGDSAESGARRTTRNVECQACHPLGRRNGAA